VFEEMLGVNKRTGIASEWKRLSQIKLEVSLFAEVNVYPPLLGSRPTSKMELEISHPSITTGSQTSLLIHEVKLGLQEEICSRRTDTYRKQMLDSVYDTFYDNTTTSL
jgi:hypothetical protein